jgi:tetratricopeptide (TPR) repeat protein
LKDVQGSIERVSREIVQGIDRQTSDILGGQEVLAERLSNDLTELGTTISLGLTNVLLELEGMSTELKDLVRLAKTPAQTAAYEHYEIARDNFRKRLLPECLEELQKAISGDHVSSGFKTEWRFHQLLGLVLLGSFDRADPHLLDPTAAELAFRNAARYAQDETPGVRAWALLGAGLSAYSQSKDRPEKLNDAHEHVQRALELAPNVAESWFLASKLKMALDAPTEALTALRTAAETSSAYLVRAAEDPEHKRHGELLKKSSKLSEKRS